MLLNKTFHILGLQLLLLIHIGHSFVLLTANIEDVKKLARKFVSESLAEKIAEFIARATEQMVTNVSAENEMNLNKYPYASETDITGQPNIARQRYVKVNQNNVTKDVVPKKKLIRRKPRKIAKQLNVKKEQRKKDRDFPKPKPKTEPIKPTHSAKQYAYLITESKKEFGGNKNVAKVQKDVSTMGYAEKYPSDNLVSQNGHNGGDDGDNIIDINIIDNNSTNTSEVSDDTINELPELIPINYSNENVIRKSDRGKLLATSGPLALTKLEKKSFWDNEMEDTRKNFVVE